MKNSTPAQRLYNNTIVLFLAALFFFLGCTNTLRIAVITDVHLNMTESVPLDLGRYGEDSTMEMFDLMIDDLHSKYHSSTHIRHLLN